MFETIKFVIPTYNRIGNVKTLDLLKKNNIPIKQIYLFVIDEEYENYKLEYTEYKIIIGKKGLVNQRQFISNYFRVGAKIVSMDDDLTAFRIFKEIEGVKTLTDTNLKEFICLGFRECINVGSYIFSCYSNDNYTRDMVDSITYDLCFLIGHFFGYINRHSIDLQIEYEQKEDYIRSLKYFLKDGILTRFNNYCFITKTYKTNGGMNTDTNKRIEESNKTVELILETYPNYLRLNKCRKSTLYKEIKFIKHVSNYQVVKHLGGIDKNDNIVLELINELDNTKFKMNYHRNNTGIGYSMTLGHQRIRRQKGIFINKLNNVYLELYNKIKIFAEKYIKIDFNCIQINKDYATKPHRDICNKKESAIIGLGDYTGGKLKVNGIIYDIHNKIISFNGKKYLHSNELSNNDKSRYSLVFFTL